MQRSAIDEKNQGPIQIGAPDFRILDSARLMRSPQFDGRYFTAVLTTKIYCRPICPARPAGSSNIVFYPSAASAEAAGYRPCLRCRPEVAPWHPAWNGTGSTVSRALKLIEQGALDAGNVATLADRLGVGSRHLLRLFRKHLGATPHQIAVSRRIQQAKQMLTESHVPITEVAFRSGFGSVRRFNAVFQKVYRMSPSAIRRPIEKKQHIDRKLIRVRKRPA